QRVAGQAVDGRGFCRDGREAGQGDGAMSLKVPEHARMTTGPLASAPRTGQYGAFLLDSPEPGWRLMLIADDGTNTDVPESLGWEHVSLRAMRGTQSRTPTWKEMTFVKERCWESEDVVVRFHPPRSEYVNAHPHVLHLWRHTDLAFPRPAPSLVGPLPERTERAR